MIENKHFMKNGTWARNLYGFKKQRKISKSLNENIIVVESNTLDIR